MTFVSTLFSVFVLIFLFPPLHTTFVVRPPLSSLPVVGAGVTALHAIMNAVNNSAPVLSNGAVTKYAGGKVRPMAVVGPACEAVILDAAFVAALKTYKVWGRVLLSGGVFNVFVLEVAFFQ